MWAFGAFCDEFHVSSRLNFKLDMEPSRETLLHFFERIRRSNTEMCRLRRRDDGALLLDEDSPEGHARRFLRIDRRALKFGYYNPPSRADVIEFSDLILTQAPAHLTLSSLDIDYMEFVYAFDLEYRGNHDELVAETLFAEHPLLGLIAEPGQKVIDCQPFLGVALSDDCDLQAYIEIKGRTATYEVRSGDYEPAPLSIHLTVRRYSGFAAFDDPAGMHRALLHKGEELVAGKIVPNLVQPLAAAIASRR